MRGLVVVALLSGACARTVGAGARGAWIPQAGRLVMEAQASGGAGVGGPIDGRERLVALDLIGQATVGADGLKGDGTASQLIGLELMDPKPMFGWRASFAGGAREYFGGGGAAGGEMRFEGGLVTRLSTLELARAQAETYLGVNLFVGADLFKSDGASGVLFGLAVSLEYHVVDDFKF